MSERTTPLRDQHLALGARFVEFGGWQMPLSYPKGTIAEHMSCRRDAVVFDVSHLGTVRLSAPDAFARLQSTFTNDLGRIGIGQAQYTHLLDPDDGSVLDDCIIWWIGPDRFDVMPNASNTERVREAVGGRDVTDERVILAVQGPRARSRLAAVSPEAAAIGHFAVGEFTFSGLECVVAGTGYTGEDGVECAIPLPIAEEFWQRLLSTGIEPAGLGARDTLRLEAGLPLHGHELGPGITPLQAGLSWVVAFDKGDFPGRAALLAEQSRGIARRLRGLLGASRRPPRGGELCRMEAREAGLVTSGNFSPVLGRGIGLAFLPPEAALGEVVEVELRGGLLEMEIVRPPFHRLDVAQPHSAD